MFSIRQSEPASYSNVLTMTAAPPLNQILISQLNGVGPSTTMRLERLNIFSVQDMLFHLPSRYQDRTRITPIGALRDGMEVLIEGTVLISDTVRGKRRSLLCRIEDNSGVTSLRFFHFSSAQKNQLQRGAKIRCFGEVRRGITGLELYHPEYQRLSDTHNSNQANQLEQYLTPIYPTTEGISQNKLRQLAQQSLRLLDQQGTLEELLPLTDTSRFPSLGIAQTIHFLHQPPVQEISETDKQLLEQRRHPLQQKLALEELVAHQLSLLRVRRKVRALRAPQFPIKNNFTHQLLASLPFQLTTAQQRVTQEIAADLAIARPMLRLLQGDVGSGKTLVAAMSALQAVATGYQVALMAPTEILAEQHFKNFQQWMEPLALRIAWLSGKQNAKLRREQQEIISTGMANIIIGTHALFQKDVHFKQLGLVIIDEQHRFGVHQRLALREKGVVSQWVPHQLIMTATPIPRTLAMCAYADLDISVIDELPPGRLPIETLLISDGRRQQVIDRVRNACTQGRQVYWVCTLIEESEVLQCQAAQATAELLRKILPELHIGLIHGRLKADEKTTMMQQFAAGEIHVLVATTVIEVGVDVPNASLMIIENPERLGLAQLHQLRGRVGRGGEQSYCVLMYSAALSQDSKQRLAIMRQSQDGFIIAEKDLELRGPGEVLGTRQTGIMQFKIADLQRDQGLIPIAQECAQRLMHEKPSTITTLIQRWLASDKEYGQV